MNYVELHIGDFEKSAGHLTACEDGIYNRLMRRYYDTERALPADVRQLQKLARAITAEERKAVVDVLAEFFELRQDGWHQTRCDEEIAKYQAKCEKAKGSANARWSKSGRSANAMRTHAPDDANASEAHSVGNAHQSPVTSHHADALGKSVALSKPAEGADPPARAPDEPPPAEIPLNVQAAMAMIAAGCQSTRVNPTRASLLAVLAAGGTPQMLGDTVREGLSRNPPVSDPFPWAITTVHNRLNEAGSRPPSADKPTAAADLRGKDYAGSGTRPHQLPPELRPDDIGVAAAG